MRLPTPSAPRRSGAASDTVDAVVVGAGPNGLLAAIALAQAGWDVLVLEAQDEPGGAVKSAEVLAPGYVTDLFSAFYPLSAASPIIGGLHLEEHGLRWRHAPHVLAHVLPDDRCAVLSRDVDETAASVESFAAGDGAAWREMFGQWKEIRDVVLDALFTPMPPVRPALRLLRELGVGGVLDLARFAALPVHRMGIERFSGEGARLLLAGNAMHGDVPPLAVGSGVFGWLLTMLGQDVGFPVPEGGAGQLTRALLSKLHAAGGEVRTGARVERVVVRDGRALGVVTADGRAVRARRGVLADVDAPTLLGTLVGDDLLPPRVVRRLRHFEWDHATVKLNWALSGPVPWTAEGARGAGTVHLGVDLNELVDVSTDMELGRPMRKPFVLFGQMATADPTRCPPGAETAWAYTHLPARHAEHPEKVDAVVRAVEDILERHAPGFHDLVVARGVQGPFDLQDADHNLATGAINGGTAKLHQQLVFRPIPSLGRPETVIDGLYLASASAHPGGGVHGAPGWNAARAALATTRLPAAARRRWHRWQSP